MASVGQAAMMAKGRLRLERRQWERPLQSGGDEWETLLDKRALRSSGDDGKRGFGDGKGRLQSGDDHVKGGFGDGKVTIWVSPQDQTRRDNYQHQINNISILNPRSSVPNPNECLRGK